MVELKDGTELKPFGDMRSMLILKHLLFTDELIWVKFSIGFLFGMIVGAILGWLI